LLHAGENVVGFAGEVDQDRAPGLYLLGTGAKSKGAQPVLEADDRFAMLTEDGAVKMAVNVSVRQFDRCDLPAIVAMDSTGANIFESVERNSREALAGLFEKELK